MLEIIKAIIYGIVEGITEWLPISSTGHLILVDKIVQFKQPEEFVNMFKVIIQLGAILAVMDQEIDITDALTEDGRYEYKYEDEGAQLTVLVEGTPEDWTMTTSIRVPGQEDTVSAVFAKEEQDRGTALTPSHAADVPADSEQDISAQEAPSVIFDGKEAAAVQTAPNS